MKGLTVKGKTTESEIVFTSLEKSIPSRNFAGTLVFLLLLTGLIVPFLSFFVLGDLLFLDLFLWKALLLLCTPPFGLFIV